MKERSLMVRIWFWHILVGVPVAAFLESVVQFAYAASATMGLVGDFLLYLALAIPVGAIILVPAYTVQALLFGWLSGRGAPRTALAMSCGALQAGLVGLWWLGVGLQPSLGGRFRIGPVMMVAAFVAGAIVAIAVGRILAREPAEPAPHRD